MLQNVKILYITTSHTILYYTILYYTILYYTILYYTILYYTILYYTILYYTILYYTILYYTILYYTILYYTRLYYTIPYHTNQPVAAEPACSSGWYGVIICDVASHAAQHRRSTFKRPSELLPNPKALRTHILRFLGPKTIL